MRTLAFFLALFISSSSIAQVRLGVFAGIANYQGDLVEKPYASPRGAFGLSLNFPLSNRFSLRTGLNFAKVAGADSLSSKADYRARNLSFQSPVTEFNLLAEYNLFNLDNLRWTPYAFAGLAIFHFNLTLTRMMVCAKFICSRWVARAKALLATTASRMPLPTLPFQLVVGSNLS